MSDYDREQIEQALARLEHSIVRRLEAFDRRLDRLENTIHCAVRQPREGLTALERRRQRR